MQGILYEEASVLLFALVTLMMGGGAGFMTGRAIAQTWRPFWIMPLYGLLLACAIRFIHFALFKGSLFSLHYFSIDSLVIFLAIFLGYRRVRTLQMSTNYSWLYAASTPFSWQTNPQQKEVRKETKKSTCAFLPVTEPKKTD